MILKTFKSNLHGIIICTCHDKQQADSGTYISNGQIKVAICHPSENQCQQLAKREIKKKCYFLSVCDCDADAKYAKVPDLNTKISQKCLKWLVQKCFSK